MRKIKITALILAVLMVMAAFAGCVSSEDVTALDDKINANQAATDKAIADLTAAIEALTQSQSNIKDSVDANKTAQDASNQAILDAIKDLTNKVTEVEKEQDNVGKNDADVAAAKQAKSKLIAAAKATYEAKKDSYTDADYAAIITILSTADIDINAAATVAAVNEIYAKMEADLAKYAQIDDYLYTQYLALKGKIVEANRATAEAAYKYLIEVAKKELTEAQYAALAAYKTGAKNDLGQDITVDLVAGITAFKNYYGNENSYNGVATLKAVTAEAAKVVKLIEAIGTVEYAQYSKVDAAMAAYAAFTAMAKALSTDNYALVTNVAVLEAAKARTQALKDAEIAYAKLGAYNITSKDYDSIFQPLIDLDDDVILYTSKDAIDAALAEINAWATTYSLDAKNVAAIIDAVDGVSYKAVLQISEYVNAMVGAYKAFAADIAPKIASLNKTKALTSTVFADYAAVAKALDAWRTRVEDDKTTTDKNEEIVVDIYNELAIIEAVLGLELVADYDFVELFTFENDDEDATVKTFFTTTYEAAIRDAKAITTALKKLDPKTLTSVKPFIALAGDMKVNADGNWVYLTNDEKDALAGTENNGTIAWFLATYVTEDYDLSVLLPTEDFEAKKAAVVANIAARKAEAAALTAAYKAYLKAVADKFDAIAETGYAIDASVITTLEFKATVDKLVADYKAWVANGGVTTMVDLVLVEDTTDEYEYVLLLEAAVVNGINKHSAAAKAIKDKADATAKVYNSLASINAANAIAISQMNYKTVTAIEAVTKEVDNKTKTVAYKVTYVKTTGATGTAYVATSVNTIAKAVKATEFFSNDALTTATTVPTVLDLLKACENSYAALAVANAGQPVADVETAVASSNFAAYKFMAIQTAAIDGKAGDILGADVATIKAATSLEQLANALVNGLNLAGSTETITVAFNGVTYVTVSHNGVEYVVTIKAN